MEGRCLAAVFPNLSARNLAVSGSTSLQHVKHLEERLEQQEPHVRGIVVMTSDDLPYGFARGQGAITVASLAKARP